MKKAVLKGAIAGAGLLVWTYFVATTVADAVCELFDLDMSPRS